MIYLLFINPFTAPACKRFKLKDAGTHLKSGCFPVLQYIYFQCCAFWWKSFHMPERKRRQKRLRVSNLVLLSVVFEWHHGSERVKWRNDQQAAPSTVLFVESNIMLMCCGGAVFHWLRWTQQPISFTYSGSQIFFFFFNPFTAMMSFENYTIMFIIKVWNLKTLSLFFFSFLFLFFFFFFRTGMRKDFHQDA